MAPSSDNEGAPRNGTAGRESLRDLPEHETSWSISTIRKIRAPGKTRP